MARQAELFEKPKTRRVVRMHVVDAGNGCGGEDDMIAKFACAKCGHASAWLRIRTITEAKQGIACPCCNAQG